MRIALVTPYSWTYEGGVNRHTQALAEHLIGRGNEVRVLSPWDPPDRLSRTLHRGAAPRVRPMPDYLTPLGRTVGFARQRRRLEPLASSRTRSRGCAASSATATSTSSTSRSRPRRPSAGTRAGFGGAPGRRHLPRLRAEVRCPSRSRSASAPAASSTSSAPGSPSPRPPSGPAAAGTAATTRSSPTESTSSSPPQEPVGGADERRSCGCCSSAAPRSARACRSCCAPSRRWSSTSRRGWSSSAPLPRTSSATSPTPRRSSTSTRSAPSSRDRLWEELAAADVLCAPSLSGESFGMVLTEAFASGTPVVASEIAGYSDVVEHGVDGVLIPPGDPQRLAEELLAPPRRAAPARRDGRRRPRERRALRLAADRRPGRAGLRAGDRPSRSRPTG